MANCKACQEPLVLQLDPEDSGDEAETLPDDLELPCGCHFHWQCLLDQAPQVAIDLRCPSCGTALASNQPGPSVTNAFLSSSQGAAILTRYTNEGGVQEGLDILPTITEEAYLAGSPEARPARALHVMAAEGDVAGIVDLLRDAEQPGDEEPQMSAKQLLLWRDPLNGAKTALHVAIEGRQEEVFWLALWLCSALPAQMFPGPAVHAAQAMGLERLPVETLDEDVRAVRDANGARAQDLCQELESPWADIASQGLLAVG